MTSRRSRLCAIVAGVAVLMSAGNVSLAQVPRAADPTRELQDRARLEAEARAAAAQHRTEEALLLNARLERGDFQDGDRIVVTLLGSTPYNDTIMVRAGKLLPLPRMGEVPLEGVLRSELTGRLSSHLAKYLRDSSVRATPLLRLGVLGAVRSPGFYYMSAELLVTDVIMRAGGPGGRADLGRVEIRRTGTPLWGTADMRTAMSEGMTLDQLHLRAGDELYVGESSHFDWPLFFQIGASVLGVAIALTRLH